MITGFDRSSRKWITIRFVITAYGAGINSVLVTWYTIRFRYFRYFFFSWVVSWSSVKYDLYAKITSRSNFDLIVYHYYHSHIRNFVLVSLLIVRLFFLLLEKAIFFSICRGITYRNALFNHKRKFFLHDYLFHFWRATNDISRDF